MAGVQIVLADLQCGPQRGEAGGLSVGRGRSFQSGGRCPRGKEPMRREAALSLGLWVFGSLG